LFPGWIDQYDLPAVYSLAGLYLYPSNVEAFPIPLTEAMACGTAIITSRANGLEEIAREAPEYVESERPDEIAKALSHVLSDSHYRKHLMTKSLSRAKFFSWDKCARETLAILEKIHANSLRRSLRN
jgi:glycosyltransferase involved in cell wall biosynthesis